MTVLRGRNVMIQPPGHQATNPASDSLPCRRPMRRCFALVQGNSPERCHKNPLYHVEEPVCFSQSAVAIGMLPDLTPQDLRSEPREQLSQSTSVLVCDLPSPIHLYDLRKHNLIYSEPPGSIVHHKPKPAPLPRALAFFPVHRSRLIVVP